MDIVTRIDTLSERMNDMEKHFSSDVETAAELLITAERDIAQLKEKMETFFFESGLGVSDPDVQERAAGLIGQKLPDLKQGSADYLSWATGIDGYAAQAGLWFNSPLWLVHQAGNVHLHNINERIVELPWALKVAGQLPRHSRVLDVGSTESLLAIHLASLGLDVTAIDPRPYPFTHPFLIVVEAEIEEWQGPEQPFKAVFCISTLEHLGLGAYGVDSSDDEDLDQHALQRIATWLEPDGELVLTLPYGEWSVSDFQRIYDDEHLERLLRGWRLVEKEAYVQTSPLSWQPVQTSNPLTEVQGTNRHGVVGLRLKLEL